MKYIYNTLKLKNLDKDEKYIVFILMVFMLFSGIVLLTETSLVQESYRAIYFYNRLFTFIYCFVSILYVSKNGLNSIYIYSLLFIASIYTQVGIAFFSLYESCFAQFSFAFVFVKSLKKKVYYAFLASNLICIIAIHAFQSKLGLEIAVPSSLDLILVLLAFSFIILGIYKYIVIVEDAQQDVERKFLLIGKETSKILHDVKGYLSNPQFVLESLSTSKVVDKENEICKTKISYLLDELIQLRGYLKSINDFVSEDQLVYAVSCSYIINSVKQMHASKLKDVDLRISFQNDKILTSPGKLISVLYLLIDLSLSKRGSEHANAKIIINIDNNSVSYKDNFSKFSELEINNLRDVEKLKLFKYDINSSELKMQIINSDLNLLNYNTLSLNLEPHLEFNFSRN